jgi:hypothetical protein
VKKYGILIVLLQTPKERSIPMERMIPEIDEIVNFYSPEVIEEIARETGFVQRESKLGGMEFLILMTQGLYAQPDATLNQMAGMLKDINPQYDSDNGFPVWCNSKTSVGRKRT